MRAGEAYHTLRVPRGLWTIVRVDGRSFTKLTNDHYERPFDAHFFAVMSVTAEALVEDFNALFASVHSDEISLLLRPTWDNFSREVEKTVSVAAGLASATFSRESNSIGSFDGRIWVGGTDGQVVDYFRWRQADATRGALNSWAYWTLREQANESARGASRLLEGKGVSFKNELLMQYGTNFNDLPLWQRRGSVWYWQRTRLTATDKATGERVEVARRILVENTEPPMGDEYAALIREHLAGGGNAPDEPA